MFILPIFTSWRPIARSLIDRTVPVRRRTMHRAESSVLGATKSGILSKWNTPKFWVVPLGLDCRFHRSDEQRPWANYSCN